MKNELDEPSGRTDCSSSGLLVEGCNNIAIGERASWNLTVLSNTIAFGDDAEPRRDGELVIGDTMMGKIIPQGVKDLLRCGDVDAVRWLLRCVFMLRTTAESRRFIDECDDRGLLS